MFGRFIAFDGKRAFFARLRRDEATPDALSTSDALGDEGEKWLSGGISGSEFVCIGNGTLRSLRFSLTIEREDSSAPVCGGDKIRV